MMTLLAATLIAAAPLAGAEPAQDSHHGFRLPAAMTLPASIAGSGDRRCPTSPGVTVCANRAEAQLRWRVVSEGPQSDRQPRPHVRSLRQQVARCANPVEDGLRCVKPVAFTSINIDD